ncbi:MAG: PKD domain-containing protein, partial [Bacteroidales bacterium]|nr:PKD domain-containing protein [Bacteroidales bacterium]
MKKVLFIAGLYLITTQFAFALLNNLPASNIIDENIIVETKDSKDNSSGDKDKNSHVGVMTTPSMVPSPPPVHGDDCGDPIALTPGIQQCGTNSYAGSFDDASGAPTNPCSSYYNDGEYWFSYTAGASGDALQLDMSGLTATYSGLFVLDDCPSGSPNCIASYTSGASTANFTVTTPSLTPGQTYYIVIANWSTPYQTDFCLDATLVAPPPTAANDECADATPVTVNPDMSCASTTPGTLVNATASAVANGCSGTANDDVWFSFVAEHTTQNISLLNVAGSTTDLYHSVYAGTCGSLGAALVCSDPNTSVVSGLTIGQTYYVRVYSYYGTSGQTSTFDVCIGYNPPADNDECADAIPVTVSADLNCADAVSGTVFGATGSSQANSCSGTDDDDVWYSFVAQNTTEIISLENIAGSVTDMYFSVYSGTCGSIGTEVLCSDANSASLTGLTVGHTYYVRVYTYTSTAGQTSTFDICIHDPVDCTGGSNNTCAAADPFCTGTTYTYCNSTGVADMGTFDCLYTTPNPMWLYLNIATAGNVDVYIEQYNESGSLIDVDFALYGPFADLASSCPITTATVPIDCSYSSAGTETANIVGANVGEYYMLLITNYANAPGYISFSQTGGTGATDCSIVVPCQSTAVGTNPVCNGGSNGSILVTAVDGEVPFNVSWSGTTSGNPAGNEMTSIGSTYVIPNLSAGTYSVSVTDNVGCVNTIDVTINDPLALTLSLSADNPTCNNDCDGEVSVTSVTNGSAPYSYTWSDGDHNQINTNVCSGTFNVTVQDNNGCLAYGNTTVINPPALVLNLNPSSATCGASNGSIGVSITNGAPLYDIDWAPGGLANNQSSPYTIDNLSPQTYGVTVTDDDGCVVSGSIAVADGGNVVAAIANEPSQCLATNNFTFDGSGSTTISAPTYSWGFGDGNTATGVSPSHTYLSAGSYVVTLTVTDGSCTDDQTLTVNVLPEPTVNITPSDASCYGYSDGQIIIAINSGTAPLQNIAWSPSGGTGTTASALAAGNYTVTFEDANGCPGSANAVVGQPNSIVLNITSTDANCNTSCDGTASANVTSGGTAPFDYDWGAGTNANNSPTTSGLCGAAGAAGGNQTYTVTVTDANSCQTTGSVAVNAPPAVSISQVMSSHVNVDCQGNSTGALEVIAS